MQDTKTASFLIVNYKSTENIKRLISEIKSNISYPYEILVFDNSLDYNDFSKDIKVYKSDKNIGFGSAIDYLSMKALNEYLFILNPDISINHNLDEVLDKFVQLPIEYAAYSLNTAEKLYKTPLFGRFIDSTKRFSSNAFVVGKEYFKILGGFNPEYFMYFEDDELAVKLIKFGLKTYFPTKKYVYHNKNYTYIQGFKRKSAYYESLLMYLKRNFKLKYYIFFIPLKIALSISNLIK